MKLLIPLLLLLLSSCASMQKTTLYKACAKPSYDANAQVCDSPYAGCDPSDTVIACDVVRF